jgi:hypothetical protein
MNFKIPSYSLRGYLAKEFVNLWLYETRDCDFCQEKSMDTPYVHSEFKHFLSVKSYNTVGRGNCGFAAGAQFVFNNSSAWPKLKKCMVSHTINKMYDLFENFSEVIHTMPDTPGYSMGERLRHLCNMSPKIEKKYHWFDDFDSFIMSDMLQLPVLHVIINSSKASGYSDNGGWTILPANDDTPFPIIQKNILILQQDGSHFQLININTMYNSPTIPWSKFKLHPLLHIYFGKKWLSWYYSIIKQA